MIMTDEAILDYINVKVGMKFYIDFRSREMLGIKRTSGENGRVLIMKGEEDEVENFIGEYTDIVKYKKYLDKRVQAIKRFYGDNNG